MEENVIMEGALEKLKQGFDTVGNAVKTTLGPMGKVVLIDMGVPYVTKDGVTVTKSITLKDKHADYGASLLKQTAQKTVEEAGDGTTTSVILAQKMVDEGYRHLMAGTKAIHLTKGINKAVNKAVEVIKKMSLPVKNVETAKRVATISANNDTEIGDIIGNALDKVGLNGTIHIAASQNNDTYLDLTEGFKFAKGVVTNHFFNRGETSKVLDDAYIVIYNGDLNLFNPVIETLQDIVVANPGRVPNVLMIAHSFSGKVIDNFITNNNQGVLNSCVVEAPLFGEKRLAVLEDIVVLTSKENELLSTSTKPIVGRAKKIVVSRDNTIIFGGEGDAKNLKDREDALIKELETTNDGFHKDVLKQRISNLRSNVATIYVGGRTEAEVEEKRDRVEDAVEAVTSAVEEGIVIGGGMTYHKIAEELKNLQLDSEEMIGVKIVQEALREPFRQLMKNSGVELDVSTAGDINQLNKKDMGFNFTNGKIVDLMKEGIIDSAKVERVALQNAASTAKMFLNISAIVSRDNQGF